MAENIAYAILGRIGKYLVDPIVLRLGYLFCFNNNIENLKDQVQKLETMRDGVQVQVDAARRNVEIVGNDVEEWMTSVDNIREVADRIILEKTEIQKGCLNLKSRYALSRKATKRTQVAVELRQDGKFEKVSCSALPMGIESLSSRSFKEFESRVSTMNEIIETLKNDQVSMIGICGMPGVGKTTMAKEVAKKVKEDNLFDEIVMSVVSQKPELSKIQRDIAEMLDLQLEEQNPIVRAGRLRKRLENNKKILVILDDVWAEFNVEALGFPLGGGSKGFKILFTSRNRYLWRRVQTKIDISLDVLHEEEAWNLFRDKVGNSATNPDLQSISKEIMEECGRLPLALVTIGSALLNKSKHVWSDALLQLRMPCSKSILSGVPANVYRSIELSYTYLEDEEAKSLFLLCCLFEENYYIPIEDLVRYGMGLRLFEGINELGEARDRVFVLVDQLKSCNLLLESDIDNFIDSVQGEHVKMHEVVRDVAISIGSRDKRVLVISDGLKLREGPKKDMHEHYNCISVITENTRELPVGFRSSKLELLRCTSLSSRMPDSFFEGMRELKVLDVRCMMSRWTPLSLRFLRNLRTLCLDYRLVGDISAIGELLNLEILSFRGSLIQGLPEEIGKLINLRLLDLRKCIYLSRISLDVISGLARLQELYMRDSLFGNWDGEEDIGGKTKMRNASLRELESLSNLNTLEIKIRDAKALLPRNSRALFGNLTKYTILIGSDCDWPVRCQLQKQLVLNLGTCVPLEYGINWLLKNTELLCLQGEGSKDMVDELVRDGVEGLQHLKSLSIRDCDTLECVVDTMNWIMPTNTAPAVFPILESLDIHCLPSLRDICLGQFPVGSFRKLRAVKVSRLPALTHFLVEGPAQTHVCLSYLRFIDVHLCSKLRNLIPLSIARGLAQLQALNISCCDMMEEVIWKERGDDSIGNATTAKKIVFPNLEEMQLDRLPKLAGFCREIDEIEFPQLKKLHVEGLPQIKCPFPNNSHMSSDSEGNHNAFMQSIFPPKVAFPSLEVLELEFLDTLEGLAQDPLPVGSLCKLRKINVVNCDELVNVVPSKLLARLRNLEELTVEDCRSVEKVFDLERLDIKEGDSDMLSQLKSVKLISLPKLNHISKRDLIGFMYIPRLSTLHVHDCNSLMYLFSPAMMKSIPQLRELEIRRCKMMSGIVAESNGKGESSVHKIEFPQLKLLRLYDLSNLVSFFPKVIDTVVATNGSLQNSLQPLFNEKVAFPILEELELGGLQNTNDIWCSQLLPGSFHKLKLMCVSNCGSLRSLFSPFMARYLVNLQKLIILTMEEAVAKEEDEVRGTGKIYKTLFPQLNHLELRGLPKLGSFCHVTHDWELPLVEYVHTHNCPELKTYSPGFLRSSNIQLGSGEESAQMDHFKNTLQYFSGKISGHDGGTGASPISSIKHAGGRWELGLTTHQTLIENGLRERAILRVDGGFKSGFGSVAMIATGCVMACICHTNNCPVGVANEREEPRPCFPGLPGDLVHFFPYVAEVISDAIENKKVVNKTIKIYKVDRAVCGHIAGVVAKKYGDNGFTGQLNITFLGSAGQSFACFLTPGMNIRLVGEANDYVGKGMAGGELVVTPVENTGFGPEEATIVGKEKPQPTLWGSTFAS
ncbi:disease resistance protein At4g27190-like isoform X1 [Camellia sinensis]|uniref:disease resistance protein At4g27190-like isoform X1 n=1 Tax=Camellia sinensis TaxID=4442 RepID=UPI001036840F|nr:disease resistance protein At4g27190-like isoform X1 [Camellia sinensis]